MSKRWINLTVMGSVLGLSGLVWAGLASAQPKDNAAAQPKQEPARQHGRPVRAAIAEHWFERMDANKDGQLTRQEAQAGSLRLFEQLDRNQDGEVTREEADAGARVIRQEELASRFRQLDVDQDGRLTADESKLPPQFFDRLDTNHDHALSLEEFQARPDFGAKWREFEFDRADANHDGKVSRAEAQQAAKERFERLDANHDGVLTREELAQHLDKVGQAREHQHGAEP
jgi:hypothetical protein